MQRANRKLDTWYYNFCRKDHERKVLHTNSYVTAYTTKFDLRDLAEHLAVEFCIRLSGSYQANFDVVLLSEKQEFAVRRALPQVTITRTEGGWLKLSRHNPEPEYTPTLSMEKRIENEATHLLTGGGAFTCICGCVYGLMYQNYTYTLWMLLGLTFMVCAYFVLRHVPK